MVQVNYFQQIKDSGSTGMAKFALSFLSSTLFVIGLVACSATDLQGPQPVFQNNGEAQYLFELELQAGDTIASLSNEYQAEVIVWEPEDNFAILASTQEADSEFLPQSLGLDKNKSAMQLPVSALGKNTESQSSTGWSQSSTGWSQGGTGWSQSSTGWSQGGTGWMTGHNGWGLGVNTAFLTQNETAWKQIGLFSAHKASSNLGLGKTIAVIDTGVDLNHPMLKNSFVDESLWRDYYDNDKLPQEASTGQGVGHGTAVSGIILQVAPQVKILPIRVLGPDGSGDMDDVVLAIRHAVKSGADVINISLGSFENSRTLKRILKFAKRRGVYIVAASGNTGQENNIMYPAGYSTDSRLKGAVFSIGSVNDVDQISDFSASGNNLFAYAPGEKIRTAFPNNRLANVSGTSFAAPIVAASIALVYDELQYLEDSGVDILKRLETTLEKDRIETKYNLDSNNQNLWKYAGGIADTNALIHLLTLPNPNFEYGLSNWSTYRTSIGQILNGNAYEQVAKIAGGGYVTKQISGLKPNTTYEIKFRTAFDTPGQQATITVSNHGNSRLTESFRKGNNESTLLKRIKVTFKTGNSTSATIQINNPSSNNTIAIDGFKLRIED